MMGEVSMDQLEVALEPKQQVTLATSPSEPIESRVRQTKFDLSATPSVLASSSNEVNDESIEMGVDLAESIRDIAMAQPTALRTPRCKNMSVNENPETTYFAH